MKSRSYNTRTVAERDVKREWFIVDADNMVVGRLATQVAMVLRGKHKPSYTPHVDCGDNVIIINAEKVRFTGKKFDDKEYVRHTGYPGGQRFTTPRKIFMKDPTIVLHKAIKGMLPKNKLGKELQTNVYIYVGTKHDHEAQQPKELKFNSK